MSSAQGKARISKKSLSLKKNIPKNTRKKTSGSADITSFFQKVKSPTDHEPTSTKPQNKSYRSSSSSHDDGNDESIIFNTSDERTTNATNGDDQPTVFCDESLVGEQDCKLNSPAAMLTRNNKHQTPTNILSRTRKISPKDYRTIPNEPAETVPSKLLYSPLTDNTVDDLIIPPTPPSLLTSSKKPTMKERNSNLFIPSSAQRNSSTSTTINTHVNPNHGKALRNKLSLRKKDLNYKNDLEKQELSTKEALNVEAEVVEESCSLMSTNNALKSTRKTFKLSRKIKPPSNGPVQKSVSSTTQSNEHGLSKQNSVKENCILGWYTIPDNVNIDAFNKSLSTNIVSQNKAGKVMKTADSFNNDSLMDWLCCEELCDVKNPVVKTDRVYSTKRFAQKGISPLKKKLSTVKSPTKSPPKRGLFTSTSSNCVTNNQTNSNQHTSQFSSTTMSNYQSPQKSMVKSTEDDHNDLLNISMNSLNDDEISELCDNLSWSPLCKENKNGILSPASKNYVCSKSDELTSLTSGLMVKDDTNNDDQPGEHDYRRYLVLESFRRQITNDVTACGSEKVLRLVNESFEIERYCQLRQDWQHMVVEHGDIINIIGQLTMPGGYIIDSQSKNLIIVHPDILVTPTSISLATKCLRRSILEKQFRLEGPSEILFLGTLIHAIFDETLSTQDFSKEAINAEVTKLFQDMQHITEMYGLGVTENEITEKMKEKLACLSIWGQNFFAKEPHPIHGVIDFKDGASSQNTSSDKVAICVSKVVDIEECVYSPQFGLKGKVDATLEVKINREPNILRKKSTPCDNVVLPLELKTGKLSSLLGSVEHRAQIILYSMLMRERYGKTMDTGLLFYLKAGHMLGVPAYQHEKKALVMKRNELVQYLRKHGLELPEMIEDPRTCSYCPQLKVCSLHHKSVENGDEASTAGITGLYDEVTRHLKQETMQYFHHWYNLISLESGPKKGNDRQSDAWCFTGEQREKFGYCFSNMKLLSCHLSQDHGSSSSVTRYVNKFIRHDDAEPYCLDDIYLTQGDYVIVSQEDGITALSTGFLGEVTEESVSVLMEKDLSKCHHYTINQQRLFRIDKADLSSSSVTSWSNIARLSLAENKRDERLNHLIIHLKSPDFSESSIEELMKEKEIGNIFGHLNTGQLKAVKKALTARDYALIHGMPGTGKTSTVTCLIEALVLMGKSILITSYTHTAVDNILIKLKEKGIDFLRLGSVQKLHPDIQEYSFTTTANKVTSVKELKQFFESKLIVATTCLGMNNVLLNQRTFDYCIVDEASQITQPVCVGALRHASVFVLVGDHYQLPPLVVNSEARDKGMDASLFKRLSEGNPCAVVTLHLQYRMNNEIMELCNALVYQGFLKCGAEEISKKLLSLPNWQEFCSEEMSRNKEENRVNTPWLIEVLQPTTPVIFINTDGVPAQETDKGEHGFLNETEATLVSTITNSLLKCGLSPHNIGIISPYRQQLRMIRQKMKSNHICSSVEVNTVDKYQGRDKHCIIISFVRSNSFKNIGKLLTDWRRVNVAITRAKHKLILIGSRRTLSINIIFQQLFNLLQNNSCIYTLPNLT